MPDTPDMQWTARADWVEAEDGTVVALSPSYRPATRMPDSAMAWAARRSLIAAAPDLLAASKTARGAIHWTLMSGSLSKSESAAMQAALDDLTAAITKAEGAQ